MRPSTVALAAMIRRRASYRLIRLAYGKGRCARVIAGVRNSAVLRQASEAASVLQAIRRQYPDRERGCCGRTPSRDRTLAPAPCLRRLATLEGEQKVIEDWQIKRDGSRCFCGCSRLSRDSGGRACQAFLA